MGAGIREKNAHATRRSAGRRARTRSTTTGTTTTTTTSGTIPIAALTISPSRQQAWQKSQRSGGSEHQDQQGLHADVSVVAKMLRSAAASDDVAAAKA